MKEADKKARVPPNSKESEMMVLGCMLTSVNALNIAAEALNDKDFYYTEHQTIFSALKTAFVSDKPADIHIIAEELKKLDKLDGVGGVSYLTNLAQYAGTSAFIEEYVDLVRQKSILRQMITTAKEVEKVALEESTDVMEALDFAQAQFYNISQDNQKNSGVSIKDLISGLKAESKLPYLKELQEKQQTFQEKGEDEPGVTGVPTHFLDIDKMLNGFGPSNLMILAARPAMGKTALLTNLAENICFKNNIPVAFFSLEMSATQLLQRVISSQSEVESSKIQTGSLNGSEFQKIVSVVNHIQKHIMIIDDQPGLKITDLRARARRLKEAYNIGFIVIDYLQLLSGSGTLRSMENRQMEISEISRMLKNLARELNIPILCAAQLSRKVEERQGHRPMMSDLRESGCLAGDTIIQDAETGRLHTIKELAERNDQVPLKVFAMDQDLMISPHKMTKVFYSGKKQVYELKTKSGRKIKASANHPFYQIDGWKRLDQMKVGDQIAVPSSFNRSRKRPLLDQSELIFLGHLLRDGCFLPKQTYRYSSADEENIPMGASFSSEFFEIQPRVDQQKNSRPLYAVYAEGSANQKLFLQKVGCHGERGEKIPVFLEKIEPNPNRDSTSKEAWKLFLKPTKDQLQIGCIESNTSYCGSTLFKSRISRKRVSLSSNFLKREETPLLSSSSTFWDEIESITELGIEDVYDATVPGVHNFVANDFVVHNSLEQDSDVVMFLLRRDYYDPYDKPGLAEVIIAKNRHGGVGSVQLAFRKEIGQFANYTPMHAQTDVANSNKEAFSAFSPDDN